MMNYVKAHLSMISKIALIVLTALQILVFWCSRYSFIFIRSNVEINLFFLLYLSIALLLFWTIRLKFKTKKWVDIVAYCLQVISFVVIIAIFAMNVANFPHFMNNLILISDALVFLLAIAVALLLYHLLKNKVTKTKIIAVSLSVVIFIGCFGVLPSIFNFKSGAVVFDSGENYTVEFITSAPSLGFVDVNVNGEEKRFFHIEDGKKIASATVHKVSLPKNVLEGNTYKIGATKTSYHLPNKTGFGTTIYGETTKFKNVKYSGAKFLSVSDIHVQPKLAYNLSESLLSELDFILCNGDMLSFINNKLDAELMVEFMAKLSGGQIPVYFARGNHEMMGGGVNLLKDYVTTPSGEFFYTFSYGDVFAIVNDLGEDKEDEYFGFSGLADSQNYRKLQDSFVAKAVASEQCKKAKYVISVSHIPLSVEKSPLAQDVAPLISHLNDVAHIAISGHTHKFKVTPQNDKIKFPIIEDGGNSDTSGKNFIGTVFTLANDKILVQQYDGKTLKVIFEQSFDVK